MDGVPTGADTLASAVAWFRGVARLPNLDDRVWDARLVGREGEGEEHKAGEISTSSAVGGAERLNEGKGLPCQVEGKTKDEGERGEEGRKRGERAGMGLVAVALAHNSVEVSLCIFERECALIDWLRAGPGSCEHQRER